MPMQEVQKTIYKPSLTSPVGYDDIHAGAPRSGWDVQELSDILREVTLVSFASTHVPLLSWKSQCECIVSWRLQKKGASGKIHLGFRGIVSAVKTAKRGHRSSEISASNILLGTTSFTK